jgi:glycosyltransferase involved in cell wall biosynthesis
MSGRILAFFGSRVLFGAERGNIEALAALQECGYEILCLVREEPWNDHVPAMLDSRGLKWRKVRFIDSWLPGWKIRAAMTMPWALLEGNAQFVAAVLRYRPTHVHTSSVYYVFNFLIGLALVRTPMVFRVGDEPAKHSWLWRSIWRFTRYRTHRFVAISNFIRERLVEHGVPTARIQVIYNRPPRHVDGGDPREPGGDASEWFDIVFVGQVTEAKGPHLLVKAFEQLAPRFPKARLVIVGRISEWEGDAWARALRADVRSNPALADRVEFPGYLEDIPRFLRNRGVLVAPSLFEEPLGNVVLEAKEAGIPAVVFPRGGLPELVSHRSDGLVCRDVTVAALVEALELYASDPALAHAHGIAAKSSLGRLGTDAFASQWQDAYRLDT